MEYKSYTTTHPKSAEQQEKESKIAAIVDTHHPRGKQLYVGGLTWVRMSYVTTQKLFPIFFFLILLLTCLHAFFLKFYCSRCVELFLSDSVYSM